MKNYTKNSKHVKLFSSNEKYKQAFTIVEMLVE